MGTSWLNCLIGIGLELVESMHVHKMVCVCACVCLCLCCVCMCVCIGITSIEAEETVASSLFQTL